MSRYEENNKHYIKKQKDAKTQLNNIKYLFSSASENGLIPWYSEQCSSTLATTYSSGSSRYSSI